jgi:hypothetical protein
LEQISAHKQLKTRVPNGSLPLRGKILSLGEEMDYKVLKVILLGLELTITAVYVIERKPYSLIFNDTYGSYPMRRIAINV